MPVVGACRTLFLCVRKSSLCVCFPCKVCSKPLFEQSLHSLISKSNSESSVFYIVMNLRLHSNHSKQMRLAASGMVNSWCPEDWAHVGVHEYAIVLFVGYIASGDGVCLAPPHVEVLGCPIEQRVRGWCDICIYKNIDMQLCSNLGLCGEYVKAPTRICEEM